jgi:hypothetical protein
LDLNDRIRGREELHRRGRSVGFFADFFAVSILKVLEGTVGLSNEPEQWDLFREGHTDP